MQSWRGAANAGSPADHVDVFLSAGDTVSVVCRWRACIGRRPTRLDKNRNGAIECHASRDPSDDPENHTPGRQLAVAVTAAAAAGATGRAEADSDPVAAAAAAAP